MSLVPSATLTKFTMAIKGPRIVRHLCDVHEEPWQEPGRVILSETKKKMGIAAILRAFA